MYGLFTVRKTHNTKHITIWLRNKVWKNPPPPLNGEKCEKISFSSKFPGATAKKNTSV